MTLNSHTFTAKSICLTDRIAIITLTVIASISVVTYMWATTITSLTLINICNITYYSYSPTWFYAQTYAIIIYNWVISRSTNYSWSKSRVTRTTEGSISVNTILMTITIVTETFIDICTKTIMTFLFNKVACYLCNHDYYSEACILHHKNKHSCHLY